MVKRTVIDLLSSTRQVRVEFMPGDRRTHGQYLQRRADGQWLEVVRGTVSPCQITCLPRTAGTHRRRHSLSRCERPSIVGPGLFFAKCRCAVGDRSDRCRSIDPADSALNGRTRITADTTVRDSTGDRMVCRRRYRQTSDGGTDVLLALTDPSIGRRRICSKRRGA
jgi:hypothetical protein